jgi:hypothetical protein
MKRERSWRCLVALLLAVFTTNASFTPSACGAVTLVSELSSNRSDELGSITGNGLTVVIESRRNGIDDRIYSATRSTLTSPFSTPSDADFLNIRRDLNADTGSPVISADGLTLFFQHGEGGSPARTYVSTRLNTSSPFGQGTFVSEIQAFTSTRPSWLSPDGLRLYFHGMNALAYGQWDLAMAERPNVLSPFNTPSTSFFANINTSLYTEAEAVLTPNELQVYFTSNGPGGLGATDIWSAIRPDRFSPFGTPFNLTDINSSEVDRNPVIFGNTLFFSSTRSTPGGGYNEEDIFQADVSPVPEPSSIVLWSCLGVVGIGMWWRRRRSHNAA